MPETVQVKITSYQFGKTVLEISIHKKWTSWSYAICIWRVWSQNLWYLRKYFKYCKKILGFPSNISCNMWLKFQPIRRWSSGRHLF